MGKNNLRTLIWALVAVVIVVAIVWVVSASRKTVSQSTMGPDSVQDISAQDTGAASAPISYINALIKYADRRIQLDTKCQAHPNNVTYKDNTGIMIDNRSPQARTVKVGVTFTIRPWGFKIVVLPDVYLTAKTLLVDCDQSQNVATILVQE